MCSSNESEVNGVAACMCSGSNSGVIEAKASEVSAVVK